MNACDQAGLLVAIEGCLEHAKTALYRNTADVADAMVRQQLAEVQK